MELSHQVRQHHQPFIVAETKLQQLLRLFIFSDVILFMILIALLLGWPLLK
jgi:heme/copper-type cytochrome/quinol oxidase subunit 3